MTPFDYTLPFVEISSVFEEHDWMANLHHTISTDNDLLGRSLQHLMTSSDGMTPTTMSTGGNGTSNDNTQYLAPRESKEPVTGSLSPGQVVDVTTSTALYQEQYPLATTGDTGIKRTRAYGHSQERLQKEK